MRTPWTKLAFAIGLTATAGTSFAAIYSCVDSQGRRLTSDRPLTECSTREQRLLNADGSVRQILPPTMTAEEQAAAEARERQANAERAARQEAIRRDRNLLGRFPDEATHNKAREAALDDVRKGVEFSEKRLQALKAERKPLVDELEFYKGKQPPLKLRQQLDANDAASEAQTSLVDNQKGEIVRINSLYDIELERLRKLWAGALPGSLGPLQAAKRPTSSPPGK
jgi:hypothetical protein